MTWLDALGWTGSALLVWSLLQARQLRFRALNLLAGLVLIAFNWALGIWPQVAMNIVLSGINVWFLHRLLVTRHDERHYQVVQVGPDDDFLVYVLRTHAEDIARFNPEFRRDEWAGPIGVCRAVGRRRRRVGLGARARRHDSASGVGLRDQAVSRLHTCGVCVQVEPLVRRPGISARRGATRCGLLVLPPTWLQKSGRAPRPRAVNQRAVRRSRGEAVIYTAGPERSPSWIGVNPCLSAQNDGLRLRMRTRCVPGRVLVIMGRSSNRYMPRRTGPAPWCPRQDSNLRSRLRRATFRLLKIVGKCL